MLLSVSIAIPPKKVLTMREWVRKLQAAAAIAADKEQRQKERAAKPPSVRGFDYGVRARRLQSRIDYIHGVWLDHMQRRATQHLQQQKLNPRTYLPPLPPPHTERWSMDDLTPIFNLTPQALGPALRAAGWKQYKVRGGPRLWAPPTAAFVQLSSPKIRAADDVAALAKERREELSAKGRALSQLTAVMRDGDC